MGMSRKARNLYYAKLMAQAACIKKNSKNVKACIARKLKKKK